MPSLILGFALGAAITYFLTSKKGQEIKDQLLEEGKKLLNDIQDEAQDAKDEIEKVKEKVEDKIESKAQEVKEDIEEEVPHHIESIQKKGRRFFSRRASRNSSES